MNPSPAVLRSFGCTAEFWCRMRDLGRQMVRDGLPPERAPLRAFSHQRTAAIGRRGIEWKLTLPEWWAIWEESGHWHQRGIGRGYMMCRKGDVGPYEVGNVFIAPGFENLSAAARKHDLPLGVSFKNGAGRPYRAHCNINGKQRHLGCFDTPEDAHAAYIAARDADMARKAAA